MEQATGDVGDDVLRSLGEDHVLDIARQAPTAVIDDDGVIVYASEAFARLNGRHRADILGRPWVSLMADDEQGALARQIRDIVRSGQTWNGEIRNVAADGSSYWIEAAARPIVGADGTVRYLFSYSDVTALRRLHESEQRNQDIFRLSPDGFFVCSGQQIVAVNDAAVALQHADGAHELVGRSIADLFRADDAVTVRQEFEDLVRAPAFGEPREHLMVALDGAEVPVELRATSHVIDGELLVLAACHDLSVRKAIERRLRDERDFSEAVFEGLPGIFFHVADDGQLIRWNKNFERTCGYAAEEIVRMGPLDFFPEDERDRIAGGVGEIFADGASEVEADLLTKDGRRIPHFITAVYFERDGQKGYIGLGVDVSESHELAERLRQERDFTQAIIASMPGVFYQYDLDGKIVRWNKNHQDVTGYTDAEYASLHVMDQFLDEDRPDVAAHIEQVLAEGRSSGEGPFLLKDGSTVPYLFTGVRLDYDGQTSLIGVGVDISARKRAEEELREKTALLEAQVESSAEGLLIVDRNGRRVLQNQRLVEMWRLPDGIADGSDDLAQLAYTAGRTREPDRYVERVTWFEQHPEASGTDEIELVNGTILERFTGPVLGRDGHIYGRIWACRDVTEARHAQNWIKHLAHYDALTGLANRYTFSLELEERLVSAGAEFALLYVDLDGFKLVNDTKGHAVGDELLGQVADRLRAAAAGPGMFIARLGGDEFAVIAPGADEDEALALAHALVSALSTPYWLEGDRQVVIGASIGLSLAPRHGTTTDLLLSRADIALYAAKEASKGEARMFSELMEGRVRERVQIETSLRAALDTGEGLFVFYQPIVDIESERVTAREALVRWHHPERGWVSPAEFIPVAELSGLIGPLGEFVLARACHEAATWEDGARVAVNVSAAQLGSGTLADEVRAVLAAAGLPPDRLEIEVTETALLIEEEDVIDDLRRVHELGVRVALDDFGTGYSSLSHLRLFPFDKIKIDGSFVRDSIDRPDCAAVVHAVADLGRRLGVTTVAEGVETQAQLERMRAEGCTEIQGYVFGRPEPALSDVDVIAAYPALLP